MPDSDAGTLVRPRVARAAAAVAVLLLAAGVPVQAVFTARTAHTKLTAAHEHRIRDLLLAAADRIPDGARYAITSSAREPNAVYLLHRATVVNFNLRGPARAVHDRLARRRVRFVIVLDRSRPPAFAPPDSRWYRVLVSTPAGQVLELNGD